MRLAVDRATQPFWDMVYLPHQWACALRTKCPWGGEVHPHLRHTSAPAPMLLLLAHSRSERGISVLYILNSVYLLTASNIVRSTLQQLPPTLLRPVRESVAAYRHPPTKAHSYTRRALILLQLPVAVCWH